MSIKCILAHRWGGGNALYAEYNTDATFYEDDNYLDKLLVTFGGIFMASTVANSCKVWNCGVEPEVIGR